jgi:hypothetical protein
MARAYPKTARPFCAPPSDYQGPLYYRVQDNLTWPHPTWNWPDESEKMRRAQPGYLHPLAQGFPLSALVDETGTLRPEWRTPMKYHWRPDKMPYEFCHNYFSERIRDVIEDLAPGRHILLPMDFAAPDGKISRWYLRVFELTWFRGMPPALHPELNQLRTYRYSDGSIGFEKPEWAWSHSPDGHDFHLFGYLNETVVGGLHLFSVNLLDNATVLSAELFERLRALGDNVLHRRDDYIPIGSVPHTPPPGGYQHEEDQPEREELITRWKRLRLTIGKSKT